MGSGKKFLSPVLYPKDFSLDKTWVIKYQTPDWVNGGFTRRSYAGQLNLLETVEQRLELAKKYLAMMDSGEELPNYQGARYFKKEVTAKRETDIITCCYRYLKLFNSKVLTARRKAATYKQYKTKIDYFVKWLQDKGQERLALGGFTKFDAQDFLLHLIIDRKLANATCNGYRDVLLDVWKLYNEELNEYNPWKYTERQEKSSKPFKRWPIELQELVITKMPEYDKQLWIFIQCVYYCAIRPNSELRLLQVKHIDWENGLITVPAHIAKTGKERRVNIYKDLYAQLIEHGVKDAAPEHYIFSKERTPHESPASKNYFMRRWAAFRDLHKVPFEYKIYGTKHTAGKELTKMFNAYVTKEHFDHADLKDTMQYAGGIDKNELKFLQTQHPKFGTERDVIQQIRRREKARGGAHAIAQR